MEKCNEILIVEDDEVIRDILRDSLEYEGYHVETAANGKEGIDALAHIKNPCLILLDLMMPIMDGWEFASLVEKNKTLSKIPIVIITAFSLEKTGALSEKTILKKPLDFNLLMQQVERYCEKGPVT